MPVTYFDCCIDFFDCLQGQCILINITVNVPQLTKDPKNQSSYTKAHIITL